MKQIKIDNPFVYGKVVSGKDFFNRHQEKTRLLQLLNGKNNILLTGDRRIGKTSLLLECFSHLKQKKIKPFYLNLDPITSIRSFIERYGDIFAKDIPLTKRAFHTLKSVLKGPKLNVDVSDDGSPTASIKWQGPLPIPNNFVHDILNLPQVLAKRKKSRFVICFDEFQIAKDIDNTDLIAEMRASFQLHDNITYVFMGSEVEILNQLFSSPNEKFFNSAIKFHVDPIDQKEFIAFIRKQFSKRNISVPDETGIEIYNWASKIPAHIQHLCACIWDFVDKDGVKLSTRLLKDAIMSDIESRDNLYLQIWLTIGDPKDQMILKRLATRKDIAVSNPEFCSTLGMNPATVTRRLHKISNRARGTIIHLRSGNFVFSDPFFEEWIRQKT